MSFERFDKTHEAQGRKVTAVKPRVSLNARGELTFNKPASQRLMAMGAKKMIILWDSETRRIKLMLADAEDQDALSVHYVKAWDTKQAYIKSVAFLENMYNHRPVPKPRGRPRKNGTYLEHRHIPAELKMSIEIEWIEPERSYTGRFLA